MKSLLGILLIVATMSVQASDYWGLGMGPCSTVGGADFAFDIGPGLPLNNKSGFAVVTVDPSANPDTRHESISPAALRSASRVPISKTVDPVACKAVIASAIK